MTIVRPDHYCHATGTNCFLLRSREIYCGHKRWLLEGCREESGEEEQLFNKVISFPMLLRSLSHFLSFLVTGGKVRRWCWWSGTLRPFCRSNCCWCGSGSFVIAVKSKPLWAAGGLRAQRLRKMELERLLDAWI